MGNGNGNDRNQVNDQVKDLQKLSSKPVSSGQSPSSFFGVPQDNNNSNDKE